MIETKKYLREELDRYKDKAMFFRRLAFVYRYGREEDIYSLINEVDETYNLDKLNEIVGRYFFPLSEQLKYLENKTVDFGVLRKIKVVKNAEK